MNLEPIYEGNEIRFGKLFAATWQLYRSNFIPILVLTLIGVLPSLYFIFTGLAIPPRPTLSFFFFNAVIGGILGLLCYMSIMNIIADSAAGRSISITGALKTAVSRLPAMIFTGLLALVMLLGWSLLLIIPGMIKSIRYSFTIQAVALRKVANLEAINYSIKLVDDYWWTVAVAGILVALPGIIISMPFELMRWGTLGNFHRTSFIGLTVVQIFTSGFWCVGETLLFLTLERIKSNTTDVSTAPSDVQAPEFKD